jgi:hypothetical protein
MPNGVVEHEDSLSLRDDPGSMAAKLTRMETGDLPDETLPPSKTDEELAAEAVQEAEAEAAGKSPEEIEAEAAEAARLAKETPLEPPKPKYASLEEAEKAANEAARSMHEAKEEAARLREAREALEAEKSAAEKELAELRAAREAREAEEEAAKAKPKLKERYATALKKIQSIPLVEDPDTGQMVYPPDYDDQVADAWASTGIDPDQVAEEAAKRALAKIQSQQEETARAHREQTTQERVRADAEKLATAQGLDMTPGSADHRLFYTFVDELASREDHEYRAKPFDEQVNWAVDGVKGLLHKKIEMTDAEREAARRTQTNNAVLGRGVTRQVAPETPKQRSMNDILTSQAS